MVFEELLEGAGRHVLEEGDGFDGLAVEAGEQTATVNAEEAEVLRTEAAQLELLQVVIETRRQAVQLFRRHGALGKVPELLYKTSGI